MSVLIKGMEMPKNCFDCPIGSDGAVCVLLGIGDGYLYHKHDAFDAATERLPNCPLIELPPHGRLIDADALRASIRESIDECQKWADEVDKDTMMYARISQSIGTFVECSLRAKAAPTIIEAEECDT